MAATAGSAADPSTAAVIVPLALRKFRRSVGNEEFEECLLMNPPKIAIILRPEPGDVAEEKGDLFRSTENSLDDARSRNINGAERRAEQARK